MTMLKNRPELLPVEADPPFQVIERCGRFFIAARDAADLVEYSEQIDESRGKHDCSWSVHLINLDGQIYRFDIECSYNHGLNPDGDDIELEPVEIAPLTGWVVKSIKG